MKVVINKCFGGFGISHAAAQFMKERGHEGATKALDKSERGEWWGFDCERNDADLVAAVEALGDAANGRCAELRIVEIPDGIEFEIDEYDGMEKVIEPRREWS